MTSLLAALGHPRLVLSIALLAWVLAVGTWRVLDYCEHCQCAWAWRRRVLDDGQSSPLCRKCAQQVDRVRRNLSLRKG